MLQMGLQFRSSVLCKKLHIFDQTKMIFMLAVVEITYQSNNSQADIEKYHK